MSTVELPLSNGGTSTNMITKITVDPDPNVKGYSIVRLWIEDESWRAVTGRMFPTQNLYGIEFPNLLQQMTDDMLANRGQST